MTIDGIERVDSSIPGKVSKTRLVWIHGLLQKDWELAENGTAHSSNIWHRLADDGKTLIMSENYREPGLYRIRDWVFERQET